MESNLRDDQKLFIKSLKGHHSDVPSLQEKILEDVYKLEYKQITQHTRLNYLVNVFVSLYTVKSIEMNYDESVSWLLKQIININNNPLTSDSLEQWLRNRIMMCKHVEGLNLEVSEEYLNSILSKCLVTTMKTQGKNTFVKFMANGSEEVVPLYPPGWQMELKL